ncbi:hypothetical protein [Peptoniphilus porci]|uniref:Uncharacterized protein n=1 Tax=Peptoniphilus porci TaxID=2652280 RepID=A0A1U7M0X7_9FIRM|nr:hypothetical protein [Peptoniphilus porci]OLR65304.1 hypothetical protein BIV18_07150 [Peptoniphilus porci]
MGLRSNLEKSQKGRRLFYLISLIIIGLFVLDIILMNLDELNFLNKLHGNIYFLDSFLLFLSVITFILGLFFVNKNWTVWVVLALLLAPNIFVFIVFFGFASLNLFKALSAYLYTIVAWFLKLINVL